MVTWSCFVDGTGSCKQSKDWPYFIRGTSSGKQNKDKDKYLYKVNMCEVNMLAKRFY
jgi:hypothetical protein